MPYCYNCGAEVNADASFCKACGNKIETGKPVQTNTLLKRHLNMFLR